MRQKTALTTLATVALVGAVAAPATAAPVDSGRAEPTAKSDTKQPSSLARSHGVDAKDGAYMGWRQSDANPRTMSAPRVTSEPRTLVEQVHGVDVSSHQETVDWAGLKDSGSGFAYVKATEGVEYVSPKFGSQYNDSFNTGFIRGAYHFALPDRSSGAQQAEYFVNNGGGWSKDGKTLPGVLDIEWNPYGGTCFGLSADQMVGWIGDFTRRYKELTGRDAVIYTANSWWNECTGNSDAFGQTNPLWLANYADNPGPIPANWGVQTIWQYSDKPLDQNWFNGPLDRLVALANG